MVLIRCEIKNFLGRRKRFHAGMKMLSTDKSNTKNITNSVGKDDIERSHIVTKKFMINLRMNHIHKNSKSSIGKFHKKK